MLKSFCIYSIIVLSSASIVLIANARDNDQPFKERVLNFFSGSENNKNSDEQGYTLPEEFDYLQGDWEYHVATSEYERYREGNIYSGNVSDRRVDIFTEGTVDLKASYGDTMFTRSKYKKYDEDSPESRIVTPGFYPEQIIKLQMNGTIDNRISLYIDHDSERKENTYKMQYRAVEDDEVIREVNAGEIDIKFNHSKYAVYDNSDVKGLGADFKIRKGKLEVKAFASVLVGKTEVEYFTGNARRGDTSLSDFQYVRKKYYQLEPFVRYDGVTTAPGAGTIYTTNTLTSDPADPDTYQLISVNIDSSGFAIYMDDRNSYNNYNAITLSLDGGDYTKLSNGTDYTVNYASGLITFTRNIPDNARIFAVYTISGGTKDPCALDPSDSNHPGGEFSGKNFVFIKYGESINEDIVTEDFAFNAGETDVNNDGKVNLDIYEVRSYYFLGDKDILPGDFYLSFYDDSLRMTSSQIEQLGKYSLDLDSGLVFFRLREPFRSILNTSDADVVYSEVQITDAYLSSRYKISADYLSEARSFKLKNNNIVKDSVSVKVNGSELQRSYFSVDNDIGIVIFTDPNNPIITPTTRIEIKYEYLPQGTTGKGFAGGVRADYRVNRSLRVGGTAMVTRDSESNAIPDIGEESDQTVLFEGDASLYLSPYRLADIYNIFSSKRKRSMPAEFTAYGEYARSYRDVNTFGKALVENMESTEEIVAVSLSEKDWQLSSMPQSLTQADRGIIYYYYYRSLSSTGTLQGESFTPYTIDYSVKPGPFNIATGHVDSSITSLSEQRSLVFDFDFTSGSCVSAVTRELSESALDLSGLKYVEVWVRHDSSNGSNSVDLYMDIGEVSEDSDGDGTLDTEDANNNGYIDDEPGSGYSEDRGYSFDGNNSTVVGSGPGLNNSTKGDGRLNTEDLNSDGNLDTDENVYTVSLGTVSVTSGNWQQIRIYIDWSTVTSTEADLLKKVRSLRLYARQNTGTTGRLFFDGIKLVGSKWRNPELDGTSTTDLSRISTVLLNTIDDTTYRSESFLTDKRNVYESLYGDIGSDDIDREKETTLQIDYDIPGVNSDVSITRTFSTPIDIRFYKTLNLWLNARTFPSGSELGIIIGSSDYDYCEFRPDPSVLNVWEEFRLKLKSGSGGNVDLYSKTGDPDFKRIKYLKVIFYGASTSGSVWLNEIYVSEPETLEGDAYWYENEIRFKNPLYRTESGTPVLTDMKIKYLVRGNSSLFSSLSKTTADTSEQEQEVDSSFYLLPNWKASLNYRNEKTKTDSRNEDVSEDVRGRTNRNLFTMASVYASGEEGGPNLSFSYSFDEYENEQEDSISGSSFNENNRKTIHSPALIYRQLFKDFLYGNLSTDAALKLVFYNYNTDRSSDELSDSVLSGYVSLSDVEKRQRSDLDVKVDYTNRYFYIKPGISSSLEEIVELEDSNSLEEYGVYGNVREGYHFPFINNNPGKYVNRKNSCNLELGYLDSRFFKPSWRGGLSYSESDFSDYDWSSYTDSGTYSRTKSASTNMSMGFTLPVTFGKSGYLKYLKQLTVDYSRSAYVSEKGVPYEGESSGILDEEYGLSRVMSGTSSPVYNLYSYYPGYIYMGRGNYGNGRDTVYNRLNSDTGVDKYGLPDEYDNSMILKDNTSVKLNLDAGPSDISLYGGVNQIVDRSNIYGVPGQIITWKFGSVIKIDLMKLFDFWFFRPNRAGRSYHISSLELGINYSDSQIITSNINEKKVTPEASLNFQWGRSSLTLGASFDYRQKEDREYISYDLASDDEDYIYIENMPEEGKLRERDYGYKYRILYETEIKWIFDYFAKYYKLTGLPLFTIEYRNEINKYDYLNSVSPEPYDLYYLRTALLMNLHKNIKGEIGGACMVERYHNRENGGISSEVFSYEISGKLTLLF